MKYELKFKRELKVIQGLKSPIRDAEGLPSLQPKDGYNITLIVGVRFDEQQLNETGWFIDTDSLDHELDKLCLYISSKKWTELFEFRPSFELVARWIVHELGSVIPQLGFVALDNKTLGIVTKCSIEES